MTISANKIYVSAVYRDTNANEFVDAVAVNKLIVTTLYKDANAIKYYDAISVNKLFVDVLYKVPPFYISASTLRVGNVMGYDYGPYPIIVRSTDVGGAPVDEPINIYILQTGAPALYSPQALPTTSTTADLSVTTTGLTGTIYWVVTPTDEVPSKAQIIAGQSATGAAAAASGTIVVSSSGVKTATASGLIAGASYWAHWYQVAADAKQSNIVTAYRTDVVLPALPPLDIYGSSITAAWSLSRNLLSSFGSGTKYIDTGGAITALTNQTGDTGKNFTDASVSTRRPALTTAGPNSIACADFDGSTDYLVGTDSSGEYVGTASGFMCLSVIIDAYVANSATPNSNDCLIQNADGTIALTARNLNGGTILGFTWIGSAASVGAVAPPATPLVIHWRHHAGTLYVGINGQETPAAIGATSFITGVMMMGWRTAAGFANFKFFEGFTSTDGSHVYTDVIADMMDHIGAVVPFSPASMDSSTFKMWYKMDELAGAEASTVSLINDATGNGNHATQPTVGSRPLVTLTNGINGRKVVGFSTTPTVMLMPTGVISTWSAGTMFIVVRNYGSGAGHPMKTGSDAAGDTYPFNDNIIYDGQFSTVRKNTGVPALNPNSLANHIYSVESTAGMWTSRHNGTQHYTTATNTFGANTNPLLGSGGFGWNGYMGECLLFNTILSTAERQSVEGYLAHKWTLTAGLASNHPYKVSPPRIPVNLWTPTVLGSTVKGWWDASDASTITNLGGGNVTWNDKSSNANHIAHPGAGPGTSGTTENGLNVLTFNGSQAMYDLSAGGLPDNDPTGVTLCFAGKETAATANIFIQYSSGSGQSGLSLTRSAGFFRLHGVAGGGAAVAAEHNNFGLISGTATTALREIFINGTATDTDVTVDGASSAPAEIYCGFGAGGASIMIGQIGEIVLLAGTMSTNREKVEGYLAHKWGLADELDVSHPYKTNPPPYTVPVVPPLAGLSGVTAAWSMSRDLVTAVVPRYTDVGGTVSSLNDQTGNGRHMQDGGGTAVWRPTVGTLGSNAIAAAVFNGTDDMLQSVVAMNTFIGAASGAVVLTVKFNAITSNTGANYQNHAMLADQFGYFGLFGRLVSGTTPTVYAYNYDGTEDYAGITVNVGQAYVIMWRHHGGNLYVSIDGGTEVLAASGNTQVMTGVIRFGGPGTFCNMTLAEGFTTSDGSQTAALAAAIANMKAHVGS